MPGTRSKQRLCQRHLAGLNPYLYIFFLTIPSRTFLFLLLPPPPPAFILRRSCLSAALPILSLPFSKYLQGVSCVMWLVRLWLQQLAAALIYEEEPENTLKKPDGVLRSVRSAWSSAREWQRAQDKPDCDSDTLLRFSLNRPQEAGGQHLDLLFFSPLLSCHVGSLTSLPPPPPPPHLLLLLFFFFWFLLSGVWSTRAVFN